MEKKNQDEYFIPRYWNFFQKKTDYRRYYKRSTNLTIQWLALMPHEKLN